MTASIADEIRLALMNVVDPELLIDVVEIGLIRGITVDDAGVATVVFTLTTPACPFGEQIAAQIQEYAAAVEGVTQVELELTFSPPWKISDLGDDARLALGLD